MSSRLNAGLNIQAFSDTVLAEYEQVQRELREIDILVKQSAAEVERHAQRNAQVSGYVRQMEPNFETTPRADIKEAYEALLNAQQRLFTMRGQLEKLKSDQRNSRSVGPRSSASAGVIGRGRCVGPYGSETLCSAQ